MENQLSLDTRRRDGSTHVLLSPSGVQHVRHRDHPNLIDILPSISLLVFKLIVVAILLI